MCFIFFYFCKWELFFHYIFNLVITYKSESYWILYNFSKYIIVFLIFNYFSIFNFFSLSVQGMWSCHLKVVIVLPPPNQYFSPNIFLWFNYIGCYFWYKVK